MSSCRPAWAASPPRCAATSGSARAARAGLRGGRAGARRLPVPERARRPVAVGGELDTLMAGLACGEVSLLAWEVLAQGADAFCRIGDDAAVAVMRLLARPGGADAPIVAGESAWPARPPPSPPCRTSRRGPRWAWPHSRLLFIGSEGDTDPHAMRNWSGRAARRSVPRRGGGMMERLPEIDGARCCAASMNWRRSALSRAAACAGWRSRCRPRRARLDRGAHARAGHGGQHRCHRQHHRDLCR